MTARSLQEILRGESGRPAELAARSESLARSAQRLSELLPTPFHGHVRLALLEEKRAVLLVDSPAWKSRLRFHLPQIKRLIRTRLAPRVATIEVKVQPCSDEPAATSRKRWLSGRSATHLRQAAQSIEDEALGLALTRLAARTAPKRS
jgi:hypothetical protein